MKKFIRLLNFFSICFLIIVGGIVAYISGHIIGYIFTEKISPKIFSWATTFIYWFLVTMYFTIFRRDKIANTLQNLEYRKIQSDQYWGDKLQFIDDAIREKINLIADAKTKWQESIAYKIGL